MTRITLPEDGRLLALAKDIEIAMLSEKRPVVSRACQEFLGAAGQSVPAAPLASSSWLMFLKRVFNSIPRPSSQSSACKSLPESQSPGQDHAGPILLSSLLTSI
jgi:hypothetical protein